MDLWLERHMSPEALAGPGRSETLVGPGYGLGVFVDVLRTGRDRHDGDAIDLSRYAPPDEITAALKRRLEWVGDQARSRVEPEWAGTNYEVKYTRDGRRIHRAAYTTS